MISKTNKLLFLPALAATMVLSTLTAIPSYADDSVVLSSLSSTNDVKCLDTSSQEKFNNDIQANRVVYPLAKGTYVITSSYGARTSPILGTHEVHSGTDMAAPDRSPVYSVADGVVTLTGPSSYGGQWVGVRHTVKGKIFDSIYIHLTAGSQIVQVGDKIKAGQQIAQEGSTGMSTGPHLHIEIWENGFRTPNAKNINSLDWLEDNKAVHVGDAPALKALDCSQGNISKTYNVAWGGFKNGEIPATSLKAIDFKKTINLEQKAAENLNNLNTDFKDKFKVDLPLLKGYDDLAHQKEDNTVIPGKSFFGWGKSIKLEFENASNAYIPLVSEPDYFTDAQYQWMNENGKKYGWLNPVENRKDGSSPDAGLWVYDEMSNSKDKEIAIKQYASISAMAYSWNDTKNQACLTQLWTEDGNWDSSYDSNGGVGIAKLSPPTIAKYSDMPSYKASPIKQVDSGLKYITEAYKSPCNALNMLHEKKRY